MRAPRLDHRSRLRLFGVLVGGLSTMLHLGAAMADDEPPPFQEGITGREEERQLEGEGTRDVADVLTYVPREALEYFLLAHAIAARFAYDSHLVPATDSEGTRMPKLFAFPTLFAETNRTFSVGARMVAEGGPFATSQRIGFGGVRDLVAESTIQYAPAIGTVRLVTAVEGLAESKSSLEYLGVGQSPESDARNQFVATNPADRGLYEERRSRGIFELGVRPSHWLQLQHSAGLTRRQIEDDRDAESQALSQVFEPGSVPLWGPDTWIAYLETAVRVDTRASSGGPNPGVMAETYSGYGHETQGVEARFVRVGGRLAGFIPVYRTTNIVSPKLVLDGVADIGGLPFTELTRQPDYRGTDNRRDFVSLVGSLDYIWGFSPYAALSVFMDAATVGPAVQKLPLDELRFVAGGGIHVFSSDAEIMKVLLAGSGDGFHFLVSIGKPSRFGDRQHRD